MIQQWNFNIQRELARNYVVEIGYMGSRALHLEHLHGAGQVGRTAAYQLAREEANEVTVVDTNEEILRDLHACHEHRPELAMVDSSKGITNFHSPSDVIVDASMPAMIRAGGKMYGADGRLKDVKAVMPESTFARIYQEMINFCKWHGNFDPRTMGTVPNVGLMAQQAEEYGSHDKTFEIPEDGVANITDLATGEVLLTQNVETGDIWRMCQVKDAPIRDWVKLAVTRARATGAPAVFWLDKNIPPAYRAAVQAGVLDGRPARVSGAALVGPGFPAGIALDGADPSVLGAEDHAGPMGHRGVDHREFAEPGPKRTPASAAASAPPRE